MHPVYSASCYERIHEGLPQGLDSFPVISIDSDRMLCPTKGGRTLSRWLSDTVVVSSSFNSTGCSRNVYKQECRVRVLSESVMDTLHQKVRLKVWCRDDMFKLPQEEGTFGNLPRMADVRAIDSQVFCSRRHMHIRPLSRKLQKSLEWLPMFLYTSQVWQRVLRPLMSSPLRGLIQNRILGRSGLHTGICTLGSVGMHLIIGIWPRMSGHHLHFSSQS